MLEQTQPNLATSSPHRRLFWVLAVAALVYALFAGLRTASDFDLGWQLATGRWVMQHHHAPSVDYFSYTAAGEPFLYPVGGSLLFYGAYLLGGYALISWIGALACVGSVALLLRRGSAAAAGIALLAVPLIAARTTPRADMFTVVLFAAFLSILWQYHRDGRAPLWLLPILMIAWVNLHFGFVSGLGLIGAVIGVEVTEMLFAGERRRRAWEHLKHGWIWFAATAVATLLNPWGWGIYTALIRQNRAVPEQQFWITEWTSVPLNWTTLSTALNLRQTTGTLYLLLAIAIVGGLIALLRGQIGAAVLLLASAYAPVKHVRMESVFACVVVVVGGYVLSQAAASLRIPSERSRGLVVSAVSVVAALLLVLAGVRSYDLVTNRHYFGGLESSNFGAGLGWWFPRRAADFLQHEQLPGEVFNTYDEGGFLTWALGPDRKVYIDGRDTLYGIPRIARHGELLQIQPDSAVWQQEIARYNLNTLILPLGRYDGIQFVRLLDFCSSNTWKPVYLDEVSAVFVRNTPENQALIQRFPVNCATAPLPAATNQTSRAGQFNAWANAAAVLAALNRNDASMQAADRALAIFPDSSLLHWLRGNLFAAMHRPSQAEKEYLTATALDPSEVTLSTLADFYGREGETSNAIAAQERAARFSSRPEFAYLRLGYFCLGVMRPQQALDAFGRARKSAPSEVSALRGKESLSFAAAQGEAQALYALGNVKQAIAAQEQAVRAAPNFAPAWNELAKLYRQEGRMADAQRAAQNAALLTSKTTP